jgi:hypothetical protein
VKARHIRSTSFRRRRRPPPPVVRRRTRVEHLHPPTSFPFPSPSAARRLLDLRVQLASCSTVSGATEPNVLHGTQIMTPSFSMLTR